MFTIATYNIQFGTGADGRFDLDRIAAVVAGLDIVALQEVDRHWDRSGNRDLVAMLADRLPDHHLAWGPNIDVIKQTDGGSAGPRAPRRQFGNLILSRFPIAAARNHLLPRYGATATLDMQQGALEAAIATPDGALRVYSTFLSHLSDTHRCRQVVHLLDIVDAAPLEGPPLTGSHERDAGWSSEPPLPPVPADAVILGDLNGAPGDGFYALLAGDDGGKRGHVPRLGRFVDAWTTARHRHGLATSGGPDGATRYPAFPPVAGQGRRLDYCFVPATWARRVASARVLVDADGSDHLPLVVEIDGP